VLTIDGSSPKSENSVYHKKNLLLPKKEECFDWAKDYQNIWIQIRQYHVSVSLIKVKCSRLSSKRKLCIGHRTPSEENQKRKRQKGRS
jgi:hypothetical protein